MQQHLIQFVVTVVAIIAADLILVWLNRREAQ